MVKMLLLKLFVVLLLVYCIRCDPDSESASNESDEEKEANYRKIRQILNPQFGQQINPANPPQSQQQGGFSNDPTSAWQAWPGTSMYRFGPSVRDKYMTITQQKTFLTLDLVTKFPYYGGLYNYTFVSFERVTTI